MNEPENALARCLRRMESLIEALDESRDARARVLARELLDACIDLHGMALARMLTIVRGGVDGSAALARLASDDHVAAALLLHGLHPDEPDARLRRAIEPMREKWNAEIELVEIARGVARVAVRLPAERDERMTARREIEEALTQAAPDLDRIVLEETVPLPADPV
jgi:hypothetical protein